MTTTEIGALIAAVSALVAMLVQWRRSRPDLRKIEAESDRLDAETESVRASTIAELLDKLDTQRRQIDESRERERLCGDQLTESLAQLQDIVARVAVLELALPPLIIAGKLKTRSESILRVLNKSRDGIVLSSPQEGARIVWCNEAFAAALGRTPGEVIAIGWRKLINPADMEVTEAADSNAWSSGGEIVNRYQHADGRWITMRWHFTLYEEGYSFSVVWFDRRRDVAHN